MSYPSTKSTIDTSDDARVTMCVRMGAGPAESCFYRRTWRTRVHVECLEAHHRFNGMVE